MRHPSGLVALVACAALFALACEQPAPTDLERGQPSPAFDVADAGAPAVGDASAVVQSVETPSVTASPAGIRALLLHSDFAFFADFFEANLIATGLFADPDIDLATMFGAPPPLATLLNYDCAIVWTDFPAANVVAQGDRLQEYVLAGGGVVLATYALSPPFLPWGMQGGIMDDGFNPLDPTNARLFAFPRSLDFGTALTGHPILDGVANFTYGGNFNYTEPTLDPGALLVASDNSGVPLIGISASGQVAAINVFPGGAFPLSPGVFRAFGNACVTVAVIRVEIDIKPGSDPNSINPRNTGVIPVAILTTSTAAGEALDFDAADVDVSTVAFGPGGAAEVHGTGHMEDVDGDGDLDMVLHFGTQASGLTCGDTEATLTGQTLAGRRLEGTDAVNMVGCDTK